MDDDCDLGHSLSTLQNTSVLEKIGLPPSSEALIFELVAFCCKHQVDVSRFGFPLVCREYNKRKCSMSDEICPRSGFMFREILKNSV
jgi:hypothetical protein